MTPFSQLLTALMFARGEAAKQRLLQGYIDATPDPDRGWALALLCGALEVKIAGPALLRGLAEDRVDPELFRQSYAYVGDMAETVSLIWPGDPLGAAPSLGEVTAALQGAGRSEAAPRLAELLNRCGAEERLALLKLATGGLRAGVTPRLVRKALTSWAADRDIAASSAQLSAIWADLSPPYAEMFDWLSGRGPAPEVDPRRAFRPLLAAEPLEGDPEAAKLDPAAFAAEWRWEGVRALALLWPGGARLFSAEGEDIGALFPEVLESLSQGGADGACSDAALDGVLSTDAGPLPGPGGAIRERMARRKPSATTRRAAPARLRVFDILSDRGDDLRAAPYIERRERLEAWHARCAPERVDLSSPIPFASWPALQAHRRGADGAQRASLILKRLDSAYRAGSDPDQEGMDALPSAWRLWRPEPLRAECVLLYVDRGAAGGAATVELTFGVWRDGAAGMEPVPVGKSDMRDVSAEEFLRLERWARDNTIERFGPVRSVAATLVCEVVFESVERAPRRKSGLALRSPSLRRILWDKAAESAAPLSMLQAMIVGEK